MYNIAPSKHITPEVWQLVKMNNTIHIVSVWRGGYTSNDEWRRSSSLCTLKKDNDCYIAETVSGSSYVLYTMNEQSKINDVYMDSTLGGFHFRDTEPVNINEALTMFDKSGKILPDFQLGA